MKRILPQVLSRINTQPVTIPPSPANNSEILPQKYNSTSEFLSLNLTVFQFKMKELQSESAVLSKKIIKIENYLNDKVNLNLKCCENNMKIILRNVKTILRRDV
ncbi:Hypothetical_protein [Hexamita inflata]|uniref:Hypothetical_protein n=1 Tax=Hexamita inflata TaxID=28002 RepID=A0AA86P4L6_9EUKA|nr:Hypothetical protein HINF_LOCUS18338 [Hexamita inflata]